MDERKTQVQTILRNWVEAPEQRPLLQDSGLVWDEPKPKPQQQPKIEVVVTVEAVRHEPIMPRGLIPYLAALVGDHTVTLDPASVEVVEACGNVYLCRFQMVNAPDPVLPIVGLNWNHERQPFMKLRGGYVSAAYALSRFTDGRYRRFAGDMASAVNRILAVCDASPMSNEEYEFTRRHLVGAMRAPEKYT